MTIKPPSPIYLGPAAHTSAGSNRPFRRIVIHSTVSPCKPGGARDIAALFRNPASGGSAHYVVDPAEVVQVVYDDVIAWGAPAGDTGTHAANWGELHIEMCDMPGPVPGSRRLIRAAMKTWRWLRPAQRRMLRKTAQLTAQLCLAYDIPIAFLDVKALLAEQDGITTHANISTAWHETDHWDPGFWPQAQFMRMVAAEAKKLLAADNPTPAPAPAPPPTPAPKPTPAPAPTPAPVPHQLIKPSRRRVFHVKHGQHYYIEDSLRGVRLAVARLFGWIDLDCQKTSDGVLVIGHGPRPLSKGTTGGFVDPLGKVPANATYEELTWDEVSRLRSADGKGYRIRRADELVALAQKAGVNVELEAKSPYFTKADYAALFAAPGVDPKRVQVKAFTKFLPSLAAAHAAGAVTIVLTHNGQSKVPGAAKGYLNFYRGPKPTWI